MNSAESFEKLKQQAQTTAPTSSKWIADRQLWVPRSVLLTDGLNSSSKTYLCRHLSEWRLGFPIRPFSYSGVGRHYEWKHTWQSVLLSVKRMVRWYLPRTPGLEITPVGASAGGVITLLGAAQWAVVRLHGGWNRTDIIAALPRIILIAPAITPPLELFAQYKELCPDVDNFFPSPLRELCDPTYPLFSEIHDTIRASFVILSNLGIKVHVVTFK